MKEKTSHTLVISLHFQTKEKRIKETTTKNKITKQTEKNITRKQVIETIKILY